MAKKYLCENVRQVCNITAPVAYYPFAVIVIDYKRNVAAFGLKVFDTACDLDLDVFDDG